MISGLFESTSNYIYYSYLYMKQYAKQWINTFYYTHIYGLGSKTEPLYMSEDDVELLVIQNVKK